MTVLEKIMPSYDLRYGYAEEAITAKIVQLTNFLELFHEYCKEKSETSTKF